LPQPLIFNIQKFSIHDGSGIRTTVFFKGCPLRCTWCHNPESQSFEAEQIQYPDRCETAGKAYSVEALCTLLMRDGIFYDNSGGGITLSGGEPMAQDEPYLLAVLKHLARRGIRAAIDTCGHVPTGRFQAVLPYVDTFLYDIKAVDEALHERYTGVSNHLILDNARFLSENGAQINIRVPVIPGINADDAEMGRIIRFVRENVRTAQINLLPYHKMGQHKRVQLGEPLNDMPIVQPDSLFDEPSPQAMQAIASAWQAAGFEDVRIGG